jgi:excisionase family DNA binding protein
MTAKTLDQVEQTITIEEFMTRTGIKSKTTIYKWIKDRRMKTTKIGKHRRVPVSELARMMKEGTRYGM